MFYMYVLHDGIILLVGSQDQYNQGHKGNCLSSTDANRSDIVEAPLVQGKLHGKENHLFSWTCACISRYMYSPIPFEIYYSASFIHLQSSICDYDHFTA